MESLTKTGENLPGNFSHLPKPVVSLPMTPENLAKQSVRLPGPITFLPENFIGVPEKPVRLAKPTDFFTQLFTRLTAKIGGQLPDFRPFTWERKFFRAPQLSARKQGNR